MKLLEAYIETIVGDLDTVNVHILARNEDGTLTCASINGKRELQPLYVQKYLTSDRPRRSVGAALVETWRAHVLEIAVPLDIETLGLG